MADTYSFGGWLKQRHKQMKLTQCEVATAVYCSTAMIKKIEADERQPSVDLFNPWPIFSNAPTASRVVLWKL